MKDSMAATPQKQDGLPQPQAGSDAETACANARTEGCIPPRQVTSAGGASRSPGDRQQLQGPGSAAQLIALPLLAGMHFL